MVMNAIVCPSEAFPLGFSSRTTSVEEYQSEMLVLSSNTPLLPAHPPRSTLNAISVYPTHVSVPEGLEVLCLRDRENVSLERADLQDKDS